MMGSCFYREYWVFGMLYELIDDYFIIVIFMVFEVGKWMYIDDVIIIFYYWDGF